MHDIRTVELHDLAREHGTPFFLYDADLVNRRIDAIREALQGLVQVFYAVKANPNLELLRALRGVADGLDVSSEGELEQGRLAGFDPRAMSFAGPAKTSTELTAAIGSGVGWISIESSRELTECIDIARALGRPASIAVRVNPREPNRAYGLKMGGRAVQFGIEEEDVRDAARTILAHRDALTFRGIHVYAGSQCFEPAGIVNGTLETFRIVHDLEARTGLYCSTVNLGGGFGVSHSDGRELDLAALAPVLVPELRAFRDASQAPRLVVFELGRFLVAEAGIYVTRVIGSKMSRGKTFFVTDGGLHHHLAAAGTFGAGLRVNYMLENVSRPDAPSVRCSVAGPSCNPTDLLAVDVDLPRPERDDLVAVLRSGSYGLTASPLLFLGRQTPAELVRAGGKIVVGRRPRTILDFN